MTNEEKTVWEFEWLTDWQSIRECTLPVATPFQHWSVIQAWVETFGGLDKVIPYFLKAENGNGVVYWPLVRLRTGWKQGYRRKLQPIGHRLFDYHDPAIIGDCDLDSDFWDAFQSELQRNGSQLCDRIEIPRIRAGAAGIRQNDAPVDRAPYVNLHDYRDGEAFMQSRKASLRGHVRRQIKRLGEIGEVDFCVYDSNTISEVEEWIPTLERERKQRYPNSNLPDGFLKTLVQNGLVESVVHCSAVRLNGKTISWHIGFTWNNVFYWYIPVSYTHLTLPTTPYV